MGKKTLPFPAYEKWTTARFWSFIRSTVRSGSSKWPPKYEVLKAARRPYKGKDKRTKWEFRCNCCGKYYKAKQVSVDHIIPCGALNSFEDVAGFMERLFVGPEGMQVLCSECHGEKTRKEREK